MGATYSIIAYGNDRDALESAVNAAFDEVYRLDELLSNYKPASEWSNMNRLAALGPVEVSAELFQLLSACMEYSRLSEGAFDVSVGKLMKTWGFFRGSGRLPAPEAVTAALAVSGHGHVRLDPARRTVSFDCEGVELDPGGIGKGYAVDRMVETLKRRGIENALVTGAGSTIHGMGAPPTQPKGWRVDVRDPRSPRKSAAEVFLKDMSMSTSGGYEKFFYADGRMYSHVMDARTGYPAQGAASVSVVAQRGIDSEAWTKPFYVNGRDWAARHRPEGLRVFYCAEGAQEPCAWLE